MLNALTWRGDITVTINAPRGLAVARFPNRITNAGLDFLRDALAGADGAIKYVAVGADPAATVDSMTSLGDEQFRKAVTVQTAAGIGELDTSVVLTPPEALGFEINEIGWFGGDAATGSADTGVLVARVLYQRTKTNLESVQIDRRDTLGRV